MLFFQVLFLWNFSRLWNYIMSNSHYSVRLCEPMECSTPTPWAYSNSYPSSQWCHPTTSSSIVPFSHLQSLPASGSFQMTQFFTKGGQSIGVSVSASVFSMNIQDCFPSEFTVSPCSHSSVLAWRIPGLEEPGGLLSMGLHRVRHDWHDLAAAAAETL